MQTRAQNEVAIEECARFAEKCKKVLFHLGSPRASRAGDGALTIAVFFWLTIDARTYFRGVSARAPKRAREGACAPRTGLLPGGIIGGLVGFGRDGNYLDFHIGSSWERGNLDGGTGRRIFFETRAVNLVYRLKIAQVGKKDRCLHDVIKSQAFHS